MDREVPLDPNTGIFVTMNPAGKKYGGRQKLPDNLKQLFRGQYYKTSFVRDLRIFALCQARLEKLAMDKYSNQGILKGEVSLYH
jgi:hypothetical protein